MIGVAVVVEIVMASSINAIEMLYSFMVAKRPRTPDKESRLLWQLLDWNEAKEV